MSHDLLPRLLRDLCDATRSLLAKPAPRRIERRVRLQLETLEEKIVPSNVRSVPIAKFNGTYKVTFSGRVPVPGAGYHAIKGSYGILIKNGVIYDIGAKGGGRMGRTGAIAANAAFRGMYLRLNGKGVLNKGKPIAKGSWVGTYLGARGTGTWSAAPFRIR